MVNDQLSSVSVLKGISEHIQYARTLQSKNKQPKLKQTTENMFYSKGTDEKK